jgi:two-component system cell cycle sensor histidine kinase/response regulator CckA
LSEAGWNLLPHQSQYNILLLIPSRHTTLTTSVFCFKKKFLSFILYPFERSEQALKEKERLLENIFDAIQDGIIVLDRNRNIVRVNRWMERKYASEMPLVGKKCYAVLQNRQDHCPECPYPQTLETGVPSRQLLPYPSLQNPTGWIEVSVSRLEDTDGNVTGAIEHVKDVTDRVQTEEALKDESVRRRLLIEQSRDGIVVIDQNGRVYEANQRYADMLGYTMEEVLQLYLWDWDTQWTQEQLLEMVRTVDDTGDHFETRHRRKDGTYLDVEISTNGAVYGGQKFVFCVCRDITERKRTEEALQENKEKFRSVVDQAAEAIFLHDRNGRIIDVNQVACTRLGYEKEELLTLYVKDIDPDFVERKDERIFWKELEKKAPVIFEARHRRKDGRIFLVEVSLSPIQYGKENIILALARDISERKHLEAQLQQAQKMEAIGTLAGGIAHDFNNILGIILGNAELAIDDVPEWNPARVNLDEIRIASFRARDVVRQLLSFARKTEVKKKPTNIAVIIKEALKLMRSSIPTSIEIRQNIVKEVDTILADPTQINQVLINLCINAAHAMIENEGILEVNLKNVELFENTASRYPDLKPGRYVNLIVSDTGHGISREDIDRIFDPYFTTKEVGKGSGMGLAVVHGIINGHDGKILVESEQGKGTTFSIFFPVIEAQAITESATLEGLPSGNETILFVDDEESLVKMGRQILERLGYKVETRTSSIEALELFTSKPHEFDLIITDMAMPKMTGDKLANQVLKERPDMPIILCTGFSEKIDEKTAREIGITEYIEKPIDMSEFAFNVRKVLDGHKG